MAVDLDALAKDLREAGFDAHAYKGFLMATRELKGYQCAFDVREDGTAEVSASIQNQNMGFIGAVLLDKETRTAVAIIDRRITEDAS